MSDIVTKLKTDPAVCPVIAIMGCTASGKSALAEELASRIDAEIISADSMQIYRGMDIGTAKMPAGERGVPYHCLDIVDPGSPYSASLFQEDSRAAIRDIRSRGKVPIICGGTFLYVRACLNQMDFAQGDQVNNPVREKYTRLAEEIGAQGLHDLLRERDPQSAAVIHPNNVIRVVRAFEMLEEGESYSDRKKAFKSIPVAIPSIKLGLDVAVPRLYERIDRRVEHMFQQGLVDEVRSLLDQGFRQGVTAPAAIGYKEVVEALDGNISMDEALRQIQQATRRYSKRQRSWLRSENDLIWLTVSEKSSDELAKEALAVIEEQISSNGNETPLS